MNYKYKTVAIAGTFDRLHKGHRFFISKAFEFGERVIIGLTSDAFVKEKFPISNTQFPMNVKNFSERKKEVEGFLREMGFINRAEIIRIDDIYGPTLKPGEIEALVVTEETREGGLKINKRRNELGLADLTIIEVSLIKADDNKKISSTRIRLGEIDRWGKVFSQLPIFGHKIPEKLRLKLKKPLGEVIERFTINDSRFKNKKSVCLISVGDEVTGYLNKLGDQSDISIVDFFIKRIKVHERLDDLGFTQEFKLLKARNPAGHITHETVEAVKSSLAGFIRDGKKRVIKVEGEEDLVALPAILLAPLGALIFYGQPDEGVVAVEVTEEKKREILEMVKIS